MSDTNDGGIDRVDLPVVIDAEQAEQIADKLESGKTLSLEVSADIAPDLSQQIRWQLENEQPVTKLSGQYISDTERSESEQ